MATTQTSVPAKIVMRGTATMSLSERYNSISVSNIAMATVSCRFSSLPVIELDDAIDEKPKVVDSVVTMKKMPTMAPGTAMMRRPMRADEVELQRQQVRQSLGL